MALVLSGAMVMSNMSAYAAELAPKKTVETEQTDETETLGAEFSEDEETPEKTENQVDNRGEEDESQPGGGGESQPGGGDDESQPGGGDDESQPGGGDEGSSVADEGSSVATEASDVEGSDDDESGSEPASEPGSEPANEPDDIVKTGTHILDMDKEFAGTANATKFSVAADSTDPTVTGLGTNDKENKTYTSADGYFKLHYKADGTRVDSGAKTFEGKSKTLNVNMQGTILDDGASIEFTVTEAPAKLKAYWRGGGSGTRDIYVLDNEKAEVAGLYDSMDGSDTKVTEFIIEEKGTYYLGCKSGGSRFFYVEVEEAYVPSGGPDRGDWDNVAKPEITKIEYTPGDPSIKVTVKGVVNSMGEGADKVALRVYDPELDGAVITTTTGSTTTTEADKNHETVLTYAPTKSMQLKFSAVLSREPDKDEDGNIIKSYEDKVGDIYSEDGEEKIIDFILPLGTPDLPMTKNAGKGTDGKGKVEISWSAVTEAEKYNLYISSTEGSVEGVEPIEVSGLSYTAEGLTIDGTYYVSLEAVRGEETSSRSLEKDVTVSGKEMITYIFDAPDYADRVDGSEPAGSKYGTSNFLTLTSANDGTDKQKTYFRNSSGIFLELAKAEIGKLQFTVYGDEADVSFSLASTSGTNTSTVALMDKDGNKVAASGKIIGNGGAHPTIANAYNVTGTSASTVSYTLTKGTYVFVVPTGGEDRGVRVHKIVLNDSSGMPEPGAWSEVDKPIIKKVSYTRGSGDIIVEAEGYIGYDGADSLKLEMLDASGAVVATKNDAKESTVSEDKTTITNQTQTFTFTPTASGAYSFQASLVRYGEDDIVMEDALSKWTISEFTLPLATPSIVSMTNLKSENAAVEERAASGNSESSESSESGSAGEPAQAKEGALEVVFNGVDEADYYVVAAFEDNTFNANDKYIDISAAESAEKSVRIDASEEFLTKIDGLSRGNHYLTVQAFRDEAKNPLNLKEETITLLREPESNEDEGSNDIEKPSDVAELNDVVELSDVEESSDIEESGDASGSDDTKTGNAKEVVRSQAAAGKLKFVNGKNDTRWAHTVYGSNTSRANYTREEDLNKIDGQGIGATPSNGYDEIINNETGDLDSVIVWSENGRGKVVPATTDGFSYYYTSVDPNNNFSLSALVDVMSWKYSNGQDGFGMMVSDTVGVDGDDGDTWTNCFQLLASKIEYSYKLPVLDNEGNVEEEGAVTNEAGNGSTIMRYSMRLGLGWNSKTGATAADVAKIKAGAMTTPVNFATDSGTLETSAGETIRNGEHLYSGEYNVVGNAANATPAMSTNTKDELLTRFRLQIEKYNNAYVLRYLKENAATEEEIAANETATEKKEFVTIGGKQYEVLASKVFADDLNNTLTKIDRNNIYIGFFAARNARIKMSEISLETEKDKSDYQVPTEMINPSANFTSEEASNSKNYDLVFSGNFDGTLTILKKSDNSGNIPSVDDVKEVVVSGQKITAGTRHTFTVPLEPGDNYFVFHAKPDEEFVPGENQMLTSTAMQISKEPFKVTYHEAFEGNTIYVKPNGARIGTTITKDGTEYLAGTEQNPTNVYDAVSYAIAGQTIKLASGHYDLTQDDYAQTISGITYSKNLLIGRNHDGTSRKYITMEPLDPSAERPVLDFGRNTIDRSPAFTLAGNYWHLKNFDVTGSRDGQDGIKVSGSHNILEGMHTYLNGNTGVQISRYLGSDSRSDWPSYNTMLNCSSYMNYDAGYEDADGFAAKLTCAEGNKFIGCIAAYNADDGWDMFAKRETGSIGSVTLENCLAFKNGYLFGSRYNETDYIQRDLKKINANTSVVSAGNGNGFKMGGDSLSGYHVLRNSIAFGNKSKGIDSNSCPDIQIYNSISFNNEVNNVAMYTGTGGLNTDYDAENIISIKDGNCLSGGSTGENIQPLGNQNLNKIYAKNNYYWNGSKSVTRDGSNKEFLISYFKNVDMNAAIFGGITRNEDGSINLHGFLELTEEGAKAFGTSAGPSDTDNDAVTGGTPDIYVFADDYKGKADLSSIDLTKYDSTKALAAAGYKWKPEVEDIILSQFAGTTVEFTVTAEGKEDRKVAISFIQLDGAELQVTAGDTNDNGILDADEEWTVEAVPVIAPAVEPEMEAKITGFKAEISETSKNLLTPGTAAVGAVNKGLNVANGQIKYKVAAGGDAKLSAVVTMTSAGGKEFKKTAALNFKVKGTQKIKFNEVQTSDATKVSWSKETDSDYIEIDRTAGTFTLKDLRTIDTNGQDTGTKKLSIKVNDTNVIKLTSAPTGAKGDAVFTIVDKNNDGGTATVTVTSGDDKSIFRNYIVTVKGSNLAWNAANIEIDKAKTAGVHVSLLEPFGKKISGNTVKVVEVYKGTKVVEGRAESSLNDMFEAKHFAGNVYELNTTSNAVSSELNGKAPLANGTYTLVCQEYTTVEGTAAPGEKFSPITVKVVESKPAVTFKQSKKVNLFYKKGTTGSTGKLMLTSKQGRVTLSGQSATTTAGGYFRITGNNTEYDIIADKENPVTVDPKSGRADFNAAKQDGKITLRAHVEGYYPAYDVEKKNFAIAMEYMQPKLKLTALDKTIYTAIGMKSADILIYDPNADMYLGYNNATIELKGSDAVNKKAYSKANDYFTAGEITKTLKDGKDGVRLTLKDGMTKGGAVKLSIKYDEWNDQDSVIVNQSIQVNASNPRLTVKPVKLNINTESFVGKEQAEAQIVLNGAAGFDLVNGLGEGDSITLVPDSKDAAFFNDYVNIETVKDNKGEDTGKIVFENKSGDPVIKLNLKKKDDAFPATATKGVYKMDPGYKSSYSFKLQWKIGTAEGETPVKLSLVSKETVTVGVSRSINMANRLGSEVTLKPKMTNFNMAQVSGVRLEGDAANLFEISSVDKATGITTVRAKETSVLKKGSYKVMPVFTVDLGVEGTVDIWPLKQVVIRTAQPTLGISGLKDPLEVKLSSPATAAKKAITVKNEGVYITDLTQTSGLENFELNYDAGGNNVIVTIKDRAGLKENTVYKITALINVEGNGTNVKQQVITIPVRVIR